LVFSISKVDGDTPEELVQAAREKT